VNTNDDENIVAIATKPEPMRGYFLCREEARLGAPTRSIFVHACEYRGKVEDVRKGDRVVCERIEQQADGRFRGVGVQFVLRPVVTRLVGAISAINKVRGYCFAVAADGRTCFLHVRNFSDFAAGLSPSFANLQRGDQVRFAVTDSDRNPGAANTMEIEVIQQMESEYV
jgi:cold shock CspA family protein